MLAGLAVIGTGLFMMKRVQTGIFTRAIRTCSAI